ncbi:hypothetical protein NAEGRDRAFT_79063 [Naegleria gruberi]|uniref:Uncharacterized protein n=1 Tax=Naegleria gruberi TaxID=5762 RepID=D2V9F4_NAEGR|nr:uncharacterized protein NAEGRDRAFT_79063 [Naegleria gruberi]EFC46580.1 hypothetical protein NAEGRDRAFT_79063 [Naegleria gruberi]|eukprot:XP_002679324.1 hypothetical protein NAEGRDRAFT_79063 [Naegleria gruberi strain NEG-M]
MGQRQTTKKDTGLHQSLNLKQLAQETDSSTSIDIVDCFDMIENRVYIENYWQNIELKENKKDLKEISKELQKTDIFETQNEIQKCVQDCYLFLKPSEREPFYKAIENIVLHGNHLIKVGKLGVELFTDILNQVNQGSYEKRMNAIYKFWEDYFDNAKYLTKLETSIKHMENILRAKAKKYFWASIILGVVSMVGLVGLGIAAITTVIGAFVGVPIVAGVGVVMAVGCSVAIPVVMNSCMEATEVSSFAGNWEDKLMESKQCFKNAMESSEFTRAEKTTKDYENANKLPKIEECEHLINIFYQLSKYGTALKECVI